MRAVGGCVVVWVSSSSLIRGAWDSLPQRRCLRGSRVKDAAVYYKTPNPECSQVTLSLYVRAAKRYPPTGFTPVWQSCWFFLQSCSIWFFPRMKTPWCCAASPWLCALARLLHQPLSPTLSLPPPLSLSHTHTRTYTHTPLSALDVTHTLSLSLLHTHTQTHTKNSQIFSQWHIILKSVNPPLRAVRQQSYPKAGETLKNFFSHFGLWTKHIYTYEAVNVVSLKSSLLCVFSVELFFPPQRLIENTFSFSNLLRERERQEGRAGWSEAGRGEGHWGTQTHIVFLPN